MCLIYAGLPAKRTTSLRTNELVPTASIHYRFEVGSTLAAVWPGSNTGERHALSSGATGRLLRWTTSAGSDMETSPMSTAVIHRYAKSPTFRNGLVWVRDRLRQPHDHPDFSNLEAVTGYDGAARAPPKNGAN